jgi:uncharacterized protein YdeI (YjbR/CyaY-like superfamily)
MKKQMDAITILTEVKRALSKSPKAHAIFEKMPPSHKREYVKWIAEAKKPETFQRRLEQLIPKLLVKAS